MAHDEPAKKTDLKEVKALQDLEVAIRDKILSQDRRYDFNAYCFIYEALEFTQRLLGRDVTSDDPKDRHVSGRELLEGIRQYAVNQFGPLAPTVFRSWGVRRTSDFGELVFALVDAKLMGKTDSDTREDFKDIYDFDEAFGHASEPG